MDKGNKIWRWGCVIFALLLLAGGALFLWRTGFFAALGSPALMEDYIGRSFPLGQCLFFFVQLLSVVLAPIPSNITALAGAALFGTIQAFLLTYAAVIGGSMLVFCLAKALGRSFADRLVSRTISEKYLNVIRSKQSTFLFLVFLLPFFPDDLICILAGLTGISPLRFLVITLIARPWGLLAACAVGGAAISIPIWAMVLLGIGAAALIVLALKYGDRLEQVLLDKLKKRT